ncbi:BQ2448_6099 [Microbotryum intermedium]|uniref:BQ2448_6099 protein n=1 Tax=Microbotryum intermedium TaxID=269621 RepID=A0A238FLL4_9BASI|nr:BQ2448_6099 [Microbotryum intermedium]
MAVASSPTSRARDGQDDGSQATLSSLLVLPSLPAPVIQALPWLSTQWIKVDQAHLQGYQVWAVEQRVTDRTALLPVITVATGIDEHVVRKLIQKARGCTPLSDRPIPSAQITVDRYRLNKALQLTPEQQRQAWAQTESLLKASNARIASTRLGSVPVTALPSLAALNLSLVQLPDGSDYASVMEVLYQNINLRRLGMGARSSLGFAPATSPQLLHFRQTFHLPTPTPSSHSHSHTSTSTSPQPSTGHIVLDLIKLVQHALSLFNLGPVYTPSPGTPMTDNPERTLRNREGDGLLCDTTLQGLIKFRDEFAHPFVGLETDLYDSNGPSSMMTREGQVVLTSPLLAALLSLVLGTRTRMVLQNAQNVPKDPFERRRKFVRSVLNFKKEHRIEDGELGRGWLTSAFLFELRSDPKKGRREGEGGRRKVVGKVLSVVPGVGGGRGGETHEGDGEGKSFKEDKAREPRVLTRRLHKPRIGDLETTELENLVEEMKNGSVAGAMMAQIWDLSRNRRDRREDERERRKEELEEGSATDGIGATGGGGTTNSEGELFGFGRGVLKGVRQRAGRAVGKIGDGLGFNDANANMSGAHPGKDTPSVVISAPAGYDLRHSSTGDSTSLGGHSIASRIASALTAEHTINPLPSVVRNRFTNSQSPPAARSQASASTPGNGSIKSREGSTMLPPSLRSETSSVVHLGLGTIDLKMPRRTVSASNMGNASMTSSSSILRLHGMTDDDDEEEKEGTRMEQEGVRRRHSFHTLSSVEEPYEHFSRRRLELDVELRYAAWSLRRKEKNLAKMEQALCNVLQAYTKAIQQVEEGDQVEVVDSLVDKSERLLDRFDWFTRSTSSTLGELVDSTKEALYGADRLRKRVDEIESMKVSLANSLGKKNKGQATSGSGSGSMKSGLEELVESSQRQTTGFMRKVVEGLERWGVAGWLEWFRDELDIPARIGEEPTGDHDDRSKGEKERPKGQLARVLEGDEESEDEADEPEWAKTLDWEAERAQEREARRELEEEKHRFRHRYDESE